MNNLPRLSRSELEIMNFLWDIGEATVSETLNAINATREADVERTTILVQLRRLEQKGWLRHRQEGNKFFYTTNVSRQPVATKGVRELLEKLFGGSPVELVKALFKENDLDKEELTELRKLIAAHSRNKNKTSKT